MSVELLAVADLEQRIALCPGLAPVFERNDKTAFTDGHIELFEDESGRKGKFVGRVHAQIRGKSIPRNRRRVWTHTISRVDLEGFLKLNTTVLFMVNLAKRSPAKGSVEFLPHYVTLSPFKLRRILDDMGPQQRSKSVTLKPLPSENAELWLVVHFAKETQRESVDLGFDPAFLQNLAAFKVISDEKLDFDSPLSLRHEERNFSIFALLSNGSSFAIHAELDLIPQEFEPRSFPRAFSAGGSVFDSVTVRRVKSSTLEFSVSEGIQLTHTESENGSHGALSWSPRKHVSEALKDLNFVLASWEASGFSVGGEFTRFEFGIPDNHEALVDYHRKLTKVSEVVTHFGADPELIEIEAISDRQLQ